VGASYVDQVFGTSIKRLSDATTMPNHAGTGMLPFVSTEYPTASPFNFDNSRLILQHSSYFGLYDGTGRYIRDLPFAQDLPFPVNAGSEPRWSRTDPGVLYYVSGNSLMTLNVNSGVSSLVHSFIEYAAIRGRGESDISRDGDHFVFAGDDPLGPVGNNRYVFVYQISTDIKFAALDTKDPLSPPDHPFNNLYIAPDNSVLVGWNANGTGSPPPRFTGVELFDHNMVFQRQLTHAIGHQHVTRDTNGEDVLIWTNSNDPLPIFCPNGIVKVRLSDASQTCLLPLDYSLAVHITAGDGNGWAYVETYAPSDPPAALPGWKPYTNEILKVSLDGTGTTQRLLHHRSRQTGNYGYQPRATVSRDGNALVFTSNYGLQTIQGSPAGHTDAYLVGQGVPGLPTISIDDRTVQEGGAANAAFRVTLSQPSNQTVTVQYGTADVTATAGQDYVATSGTLTFTPGRTYHSIYVPILTDAVVEGSETFTVTLTNPQSAGTGGFEATGTIDPPPTAAIVPMYRAYNISADYHFFTTSLGEKNNAVNFGYRDESSPLPFQVRNTQVAGASALFRMYNPNNGRHYYTASAGERDSLMNVGLIYEKDEGFIYGSFQPGTVEIFRMYNVNSGTHLYTKNPGERDFLLATFPGIWVQHASLGFAVP
jgi:Calx-beta domain/Repeat of unknown function (DUF5648)